MTTTSSAKMVDPTRDSGVEEYRPYPKDCRSFQDVQFGDWQEVAHRTMDKVEQLPSDSPVAHCAGESAITLAQMLEESARGRYHHLTMTSAASIVTTLDHFIEVHDQIADTEPKGFEDDLVAIHQSRRHHHRLLQHFQQWKRGELNSESWAAPNRGNPLSQIEIRGFEDIPFDDWRSLVDITLQKIDTMPQNSDAAVSVSRSARMLAELIREASAGRFSKLSIGDAASIVQALDYFVRAFDRIPDTRDGGYLDDLEWLERVIRRNQGAVEEFRCRNNRMQSKVLMANSSLDGVGRFSC